MRMPKLSAELAIGPALGHYLAASAGAAPAGPALVPMLNNVNQPVDLGRCPQGSHECPPGGAQFICCDNRNFCALGADGVYRCLVTMQEPPDDRPPTPPGTYGPMPPLGGPGGGAPISA